jgi:osmotically-inducible protein OsmY
MPYIAALCAALTGSVMLATGTGCASTPTRESVGESVDDSLITTKVKTAFVNDSTVSALDISVETFKGTVQLSGFVNTVTEKDRAAALAREVRGVKVVRNDIRVKSAG